MARLLVGTDEGLFELAPDGAVAATHLHGRRVGAVAGGPSGWWALMDGAEVGHAGAELVTWERCAQGPDGSRLTCLLPDPGGLLVGTAGAHLLRVDEHGRLAPVGAFDQVPTRNDWYTPWGGPADTRWLASGGGALFANVHVGGIVLSSDQGSTWHQTSLDIHADVHQVLVAPGRSAQVLAACAEGLAVSEDLGGRWRIDDSGLHASYARALAVAGDTVVISASTGPRGDRCALYRRPLASDGPFERCQDGLPEWFDANIDTACLAATGDTVVAATPSGEVFSSGDQGRTWRRLTADLPAVQCVALAA